MSERHLNCCIGSKVTPILMNGRILPTGGAASGRVCTCSLRSRLVYTGTREYTLYHMPIPGNSNSRPSSGGLPGPLPSLSVSLLSPPWSWWLVLLLLFLPLLLLQGELVTSPPPLIPPPLPFPPPPLSPPPPPPGRAGDFSSSSYSFSSFCSRDTPTL